jgi:hypothetical protein
MAKPMTRPADSAQMNHQPSKLVYPRTRQEAAEITAAMDAVIEDGYACPSADASNRNAPAHLPNRGESD